jgi:hypothetical protein
LGVLRELGFSAGLADALIFVWVAPGSKLNTLIDVVLKRAYNYSILYILNL